MIPLDIGKRGGEEGVAAIGEQDGDHLTHGVTADLRTRVSNSKQLSMSENERGAEEEGIGVPRVRPGLWRELRAAAVRVHHTVIRVPAERSR